MPTTAKREFIARTSIDGIRSVIDRLEKSWLDAKTTLNRLGSATTDAGRLHYALALSELVGQTERLQNDVERWCRLLNDNHFPKEAVQEAATLKQQLMAATGCMRSPVAVTMAMDEPGGVARAAFERIVELSNK